jgi:hypothetical protein
MSFLLFSKSFQLSYYIFPKTIPLLCFFFSPPLEGFALSNTKLKLNLNLNKTMSHKSFSTIIGLQQNSNLSQNCFPKCPYQPIHLLYYVYIATIHYTLTLPPYTMDYVLKVLNESIVH